MIPAIRFPNTVVELKAMAALIIIPKKLRICPFSVLSMGSARTNPSIPRRIIKKAMAPLVIFPFEAVDFDLLKIQAFKTSNRIKTNNTIVGSIKDLNILIIASILMRLGYVVHIVLLPHYQHVRKNKPPGVKNGISLNIRQKNNVYNVPQI